MINVTIRTSAFRYESLHYENVSSMYGYFISHLTICTSHLPLECARICLGHLTVRVSHFTIGVSHGNTLV